MLFKVNKMPKSKIQDYIFYKIVCLDNSCDLCYVGSTVNWKARAYRHKNNCINEKSSHYNIKVYQIIRANGGWVNFKMIQIATRDQLSIRQAEQIEEEYRVQLKANMNTNRCYLSEEQKLERDKQYREANKDKRKEYSEEYYKNNKDKFKEYNDERYKNNRDKILEYSKEYKTNNVDKIKARETKKITCECGCEVIKRHLERHKKSKKHINLMCSIKNISVVT